jgi:hypothetical protein
MMISLIGKTYEWKSQLKRAGFQWNATRKTWDRDEAIDTSADANFFEHRQIQLGIECGDLRYADDCQGGLPTRYTDANAHTAAVLYGANHE